MAATPSQILKAALDRYQVMDDYTLKMAIPKLALEKMAHHFVMVAIGLRDARDTTYGDMALIKYTFDRLLGKAAIAPDSTNAPPPDLHKALADDIQRARDLVNNPAPVLPKLRPPPPRRIK